MELKYWLMSGGWIFIVRCQLAGVRTSTVLPEVAFEGSMNRQAVFSLRHVRFMAEQQLTD